MKNEKGFSLIEVMVAMAITVILMGAVFTLLQNGQKTFSREGEVSAMNQATRVGLDMISRDLMVAGFKTPPALAIIANDGGGIQPDTITILYADPEVPISVPHCPGDGTGCGTIMRSAQVFVDTETFDPPVEDPSTAYRDGQVLIALETWDCDGNGMTGIVPFEVTNTNITNQGGQEVLAINHNPGSDDLGLNLPGGFDRQINGECSIIGSFRVIQYRINPEPPAAHPALERKDVDQPWIPVAADIENLQFEYALGTSDVFVDSPPHAGSNDPQTWITQVRVTVAGRSESTNLPGATQGVFSAEDTHLRRTFSTIAALRNQLNSFEEAQLYASSEEN